MNPTNWKQLIYESCSRIADKKYQSRAWFGLGSEVSSPEELYCELFDDLLFEEFLESKESNLSQEHRNIGLLLKDTLNDYPLKDDDFIDPQIVIDDPKWEEVRKLAKRFLELFERPENGSSRAF